MNDFSDLVLTFTDKEMKEHNAEIIDAFVAKAMVEFQKFEKEKGYPKINAIDMILSNVAEELKNEL